MTTPQERDSADQWVSPELDGDERPRSRPAAIFVMVIAVAAATIITIAFANPSTRSFV